MSIAFAVILAWLVCFTALNVLLKQGLVRVAIENGAWPLVRDLAASPWAYLAVLLYVACALFYLVALRLLPLSVVGPAYMTLGVFSAALTGILYFSEPVNAAKITGLALCAGGVILLSLSSGGS